MKTESGTDYFRSDSAYLQCMGVKKLKFFAICFKIRMLPTFFQLSVTTKKKILFLTLKFLIEDEKKTKHVCLGDFFPDNLAITFSGNFLIGLKKFMPEAQK